MVYNNKENKSLKTLNKSFVAYSSTLKKREDYSWDFKKANTKEYTHCFHSYPAMMIPQVARRIIENYGLGSKLLFDPFCGTGTSLVEANLKGINAVGADINPLARLIAKVKTTRININYLDSFLQKFFDNIFKLNFSSIDDYQSELPKIKNIDYWFSRETQVKLNIVFRYVESIEDEKVKNFFKVAFSETVRESSFVRSNEFKLVRIKNLEDKKDVDVFAIMSSKLLRNRQGLIEFQNVCPVNVESKIYDINSTINIPLNILTPNSVDIVVTSPPYGDSKTTVAYGQFSRFSNEWLGYKDAHQIDKKLMGGMKIKNLPYFNSRILNDTLNTLNKIDEKRTLDVLSFYNDFQAAIKNISKVVKKNGFACFVVGNRTVKNITIPNDEITVEFLTQNGFLHIETIIRNIPSKRMPIKNSPSNIIGETSTTMKNEYIVICQKIK